MLLHTIKTFIDARIREHPQIEPWLGDWSPNHETQINIDPTGLEPGYRDIRDSKPSCWMDEEGYEHRNIRIPFGANTNPSFKDRQVIGPIHRRWQYIGTSGWNWEKKRSMWVGFDFDSIANHENGLKETELRSILDAVESLDYVVARTSKSGKGIHLLVPLVPWVTTRNHTEHSQLAKHVLSRMSRDCGYQFHAALDCCGLILWHWEKGLRENGLHRIK